jgi:SAM-dependent methyltransferase
MPDKRKKMLEFWSERVKRYGGDPRANTNDIWLREIEINSINKIISLYNVKNILDFGCANGYSTIVLSKANHHCTFLGSDLNHDMIEAAMESAKGYANLTFLQIDLLKDTINKKFDFIYSIRVFQNIETEDMQRDVFDRLYNLLEPNGFFYFIESYASGYEQINMDRSRMGLPLLPVHPHLTLLTEEFDKHILKKMTLLERSSPSSSYYLITRLLYSYLALMNNEPIDYDHPIHRAATLVPAIGDYGPQRSMLFQKRAL